MAIRYKSARKRSGPLPLQHKIIPFPNVSYYRSKTEIRNNIEHTVPVQDEVYDTYVVREEYKKIKGKRTRTAALYLSEDKKDKFITRISSKKKVNRPFDVVISDLLRRGYERRQHRAEIAKNTYTISSNRPLKVYTYHGGIKERSMTQFSALVDVMDLKEEYPSKQFLGFSSGLPGVIPLTSENRLEKLAECEEYAKGAYARYYNIKAKYDRFSTRIISWKYQYFKHNKGHGKSKSTKDIWKKKSL